MFEWIYKTTAKNNFGLTDCQIYKAIDLGWVSHKNIENPHDRFKTSLLLKRGDLLKNLERIRALSDSIYPSYWSLIRKFKEIRCPICNEKLKIPKNSDFNKIFNNYFERNAALFIAEKIELIKEELEPELKPAKNELLLEHYRNAHTKEVRE